ncbi:MAG TPA: hypothetical protein VMI53_00160 [Opitutaceae bacterium]|nr:hypothetical protein [Opitutaceae bacterium]
MKLSRAIVLCLAGLAAIPGRADYLDRIDDALTLTAAQDRIRARISGTLDLEDYALPQPPPGLLFSDQHNLVTPRLSLFLDAQLGGRVYVFAESRVDRGFDPSDDNARARLDEYAVRFSPASDASLNFQIGKFATVVGNWVTRHGSWENPFVTAPLPYENLMGLWDVVAATSPATILKWAHLAPPSSAADEYADKTRRLPIIWGPSYATGAAVTGEIGKFDYAVEVKNASLSSRPQSWPATRADWRQPTVSGRLGYQPDEAWNWGFSASTGSYLRPVVAPTLAAGRSLNDYRETVFGQDAGYAWHYWQLWAEVYEARFAVPRVGNADTLAYYLEAKYKFTPQFFGALRWNQQLFATIPDGVGGTVRWGRNIWRLDAAPAYRFTPHTQLKFQYSLQYESLRSREFSHTLAIQFTVRF